MCLHLRKKLKRAGEHVVHNGINISFQLLLRNEATLQGRGHNLCCECAAALVAIESINGTRARHIYPGKAGVREVDEEIERKRTPVEGYQRHKYLTPN